MTIASPSLSIYSYQRSPIHGTHRTPSRVPLPAFSPRRELTEEFPFVSSQSENAARVTEPCELFLGTLHHMAPYEYTPLLSGKELRLLHLLPGRDSEDIQVELFTVDFQSNDPSHYEALSYVWGSTTDRPIIRVHRGPREIIGDSVSHIDHLKSISKEAETLAVTQNLETALRHLRLLDGTRVLWVDAICINQGDVEERSVEVGRMGTIFSTASQVVVWLGPESEDSTLAVDVLQRIGYDTVHDSITRETYARDDTETALFEKNKQVWMAKQANWAAVKHLLERDWFTRLWVVQEIKSAAQAIITVGHFTISWSIFNIAIQWIWRFIVPFMEMFDSVDLLRLDFMIIKQKRFNLVQVTHATERSSCSDSRDRVYAILGLIDAELNIEPNYWLSPDEVYKDLTVRYIKATSRLDILELCVMQSQSLPSWVPNLFIRIPTSISALHRASGRSVHEFNVPIDSNLLTQGVYMSSVHFSSVNHISDWALQGGRLPAIQSLCDSWLPNDVLTATYKYGGTLIDAYLSTLVGGNVKGNIASNSAEMPTIEDYRSFYNKCIRGQQTEQLTSIQAGCRDYLLYNLPGRTLFTTADGHVGLGPAGAGSEDHISIILGSNSPLLLRPVLGQHGHYRVVGECYVHGLMNGEGLLGPIPAAWERKPLLLGNNAMELWEHASEGRTHNDPRLGSLPDGWRRVFEDKSGNITYQSFDSDGTPHHPCFEKIETEVRTFADPRLTAEALRVRGTDIKDFILV